jgi:hypothetical protein
VIGAIKQGPNILQLFEFLAPLEAVQALAPQAHPIEPPHPAWMPFHEAVRRHITINTGHATNHGHATDMDELVDSQTATDHSPIFNQNVACNLDAI